ncbi:tetratricopeptide repeat protein [Bdellovibrio sp. HCB337]|uniref:tetratricopeptide repeat protein n=1 Tax=Bdellovibrio sp. HCB337 TaxID=3394358 RepID=UPI0039A4C842
MKRLSLFLFSLVFGLFSFAKENKISQSQAIMVELRDPIGEQEERMIRVKELESSKVTQLTLQKDPSTPQVWNGYFVIQFFIGDTSTRTLDFQTSTGESFFAYISQEKAVQKVILFKTPEELALHEATVVEEKQKIAEKQIAKQIQVAKPKGGNVPINKEKIEQLVRQQGRLQETTQLSLEESQAKKRMALIEQQQKMSEEAKKKKQADAAALAAQADALYSKRNYKEAEKLYAQATELDPTADTYMYRYGVSLYKIGNYNKSLAILSLADVSSDQAIEKDYYIALNNLKLKDNDKALKKFVEIREENSPELSPISSFYAGNIELQQQKFPEARKSMEYVLDNSKDPKLDKSAEDLLEQIDKLESYYESKKEKYRFSVFGGLIYDTNILNIAENNVATDVKAWRLNYGASALAFLQRSMTSDFGAKAYMSDYYSVNSTFKNDATIQAADALEFGLSLPYHQEFKFSKKQGYLEVVPTYKNVMMSPDGSGSREVVLRTTEFATTASVPVKQDLMLSTRLDLGMDDSTLETSVGDDDLSGTRYGLTLMPIQVLDMKGEKTLTGEFSYLLNNANGKNYKYNRFGLAATYSTPAYAKGTGSLRADYSIQNYAEATTPRKDTVISLTASYTKDLNKKWNMLLSAQATTAGSDVETYKYNKFLITSLFTYTHSILQK